MVIGGLAAGPVPFAEREWPSKAWRAQLLVGKIRVVIPAPDVPGGTVGVAQVNMATRRVLWHLWQGRLESVGSSRLYLAHPDGDDDVPQLKQECASVCVVL